jgi:hypothetical protein
LAWENLFSFFFSIALLDWHRFFLLQYNRIIITQATHSSSYPSTTTSSCSAAIAAAAASASASAAH